jgi:branched-chain amino acid transport system permease protein
MMDTVLLIVLYGLSLGFIYALIAIGLSLVYGYMGVINLGHGVFYALGAYMAFTALSHLGNFWLGLLIAFPMVMFLGLILERSFIRRLYGKDVVYSVVMTLGLQMILIDTIKIIWGLEPKPVGDPIQVSLTIPIVNVSFPIYRLLVMLFGVGLYTGLWLFLTRTMIGKVIIAGIEDLQGVQALGINPLRSFTLIFALGAGLAGISGVLYAPIIMPYPYMGFEVVLYAFAIVAMGGLANLKGTLAAALIIGESMSITGYIWSPAAAVIPFIILAVIFALKPEGLLGA